MPPPVGLLCLFKVLKKGQTPQGYHFPTIGEEVSSQQVQKEGPSHMDILLCSPLWEKHVIRHQVKVANGLSGVLPPQHVKTQLDTRHTFQTDDSPFETKAGHAVEVVGSHRQLPLSNMKGVGSIPPPLNEALHQGSTRGLLRKKSNDRLKALLPNIGLGFKNEKVVPLHHLIGASLTSIRR